MQMPLCPKDYDYEVKIYTAFICDAKYKGKVINRAATNI